MKCFYCGCGESKVLDSRSTDDGKAIRRRRECENCKRRFTTYEEIEQAPVYVGKKDSSRQPFIAQKLKASLVIACKKRPITENQINEIYETVATKIYDMQKKEVSSKTIGSLVLSELKKYDIPAYIRYASIFHNFSSAEDYINFISLL